MSSTILTIEPYARLITMLGDQLIKNETIALIELIKNSYDADASWVKVSFIGFGEDFSLKSSSKIMIEDDGCGMDGEILKNHWLNPATPDKLERKRMNPRTSKGRILQGEKGIGRFAIFKLGRRIRIISRREMLQERNAPIKETPDENVLTYDFSKYDEDFLHENGEKKQIYLKNLQVRLDIQTPQEIVEKDIQFGSVKRRRPPHGTIIEISDLKSEWSDAKIKTIQKEIGKLQPILKIIASDNDEANEIMADFSVWIYKNDALHPIHEEYKEKLINCLENKAVLKIKDGFFSAGKKEFQFTLNGEQTKIDFKNQGIYGLKQFQRQLEEWNSYPIACGDFRYEFYIFDLNIRLGDSSRYALDRDEQKIIKEHRIYLYRDDIRVMPYGDPDDDWLGLDIARGTISASGFLSNDQVVGCVYITQQQNPELKDKTNREGLIEMGRASSDFTHVLQLFLKYVRVNLYKDYLKRKKRFAQQKDMEQGKFLNLLSQAREKFSSDAEGVVLTEKLKRTYLKEKNIFKDRLATTENLAAVGLSVETASHDVILLIRKVIDQINGLMEELKFGMTIDGKSLFSRLRSIRDYVVMIETQLQDIRMLFPSAKKRTKQIHVQDIVEKVYRLYKHALDKYDITFHLATLGKPLIVRATDAVLLQVCVNLFDNALYWLKADPHPHEKRIEVLIDGNSKSMLFSDNGPGVLEQDQPYIFDAFYSGKGEDGKGLGLYIARQLLERYDYKIELKRFSREEQLKGASFIINFAREDLRDEE